MGLRDLKIKRTTVKTPSGEFAVRGLSLSDVMTLASTHGPTMAMLFAKVMDKDAKLTEGDVKTVITKLLPQAPAMVGELIALAADEPEASDVAGAIGFTYQVEAIEAIFHNTFQSDAELKKFMETIIRMISGVTGSLNQMRLPLSELGFGESDAK